MANFFIAVGGTGQQVAIAYWRLLQLIPRCKPAQMSYMDKDPILNIAGIIPSLQVIDPLPAGVAANTKFKDYFHDPANPELTNDILDGLFSSNEQNTLINTGMYGRPPVGASMIKSKLLGALDPTFSDLINTLTNGNQHTVVISGSAAGGTGAGGVPSVAQYIHQRLVASNRRKEVGIYVFYFLKHFTLTLPDGGDPNTAIVNDQIEGNAESGMCYLQDEIVSGVNTCFLLGLNNPPTRNYQQVGAQQEQCHFLHLLSAVKAHNAFFENIFPSNPCAYAIPDAVPLIDDLRMGLPQAAQISLGKLLRLNKATLEFLLLFKKLIDSPAGFSFWPSLPVNFSKILKALNQDQEVLCSNISEGLRVRVEQLTSLYNWFVTSGGILDRARQDGFLNFEQHDIKPMSKEYEKLKGNPMGFIRKWCTKMRNDQFSKNDYGREICNELENTLYNLLMTYL